MPSYITTPVLVIFGNILHIVLFMGNMGEMCNIGVLTGWVFCNSGGFWNTIWGDSKFSFGT